MKQPVVIIGIGEMGGVFARGFLRLGHPVYPVGRTSDDLATLADEIPPPALVLVAVGEADLQGVLESLPDAWRDRVGLLQNELLPADYARLPEPTVVSVWFEKKKGRDAKAIIPSPVQGPLASLIADALAAVDIPTRELSTDEQMLFELVVKNLYILTTNIAGLRAGGTVSALWAGSPDLARAVASDVIDIQEAMTGREFDREHLLQAMRHAFDGDPDHGCAGRSAPARLGRALAHADHFRLDVPTLRAIAAERADD